MTRRLVSALIALALLPAAAVAIPRMPEPRQHPRDAAGAPTYVRRVEPAIVGLKVRARANATSSARLGVHRFASAVVFDARGYAVTVSYAIMDAVEIEAVARDGLTVAASVAGFDFESGLALVRLDGGTWEP